MDYQKLANLLFPNVTATPEDMENRYPPRKLPEGAKVTRMAPSPTGFMHLGNLFGAITDERLAHQSGGIFMLRIEDTDKKREVENGVETIISVFKKFGLNFDEGALADGEFGDYGPYRQRQRADIYHVFAKKLVEEGKAYPCFCTEEELSSMREQQEAKGVNTGYYGEWAMWRGRPMEDIEAALAEGKAWVLRFYSEGNPEKYIHLTDLVKGKIDMPENDQDIVLLKSDGIPTYHFAHVCDDHFMRTTHVIRGEEWISSVPKHIALFKACGYRAPKYAHTPQVMKIDEETGAKRKLSKRKDPEAAVSYFVEQGYPKESVIEYIMTLLNSNFEDWRRANPTEDCWKFPFNLKKMSVSGCLFDMAKLNDVSKNVISLMSADKVYADVAAWAEKYDKEFYDIFTADPARSTAIVNIDRENPKPRKDIAKWSEVRNYVAYFFPELYKPDFTLPENISRSDAAAIVEKYLGEFSLADDKDQWFARIKGMCEPLGFTPNVKEYKKNPESYKGHVGDVSSVIRIALTSRRNTPDLYSIMALLGEDEIKARLGAALKAYTE